MSPLTQIVSTFLDVAPDTRQHICIVVYLFTDVFVVGTQRGIHTECCLSQFIANSYVILNTKHETGITGLTRGMAALPQGNQELLVVRDKFRRPQVSLE